MKTKEELNALKEKVETMRRKLAELTPEELEQVSGGTGESDAGRYTISLAGDGIVKSSTTPGDFLGGNE